MNDKQKIATFILALICNFTFLATAQTSQRSCKEFKKPATQIHSHGMDSMKPEGKTSISPSK